MSNEPTPTEEQLRTLARLTLQACHGYPMQPTEDDIARLVRRFRTIYERGRADAIAQFRGEVAGVVEPLRELEAKATKGPWERGYGNDVGPEDDCFWEWETAGPAQLHEPGEQAKRDADLIVELRNALPKLLALLPAPGQSDEGR